MLRTYQLWVIRLFSVNSTGQLLVHYAEKQVPLAFFINSSILQATFRGRIAYCLQNANQSCMVTLYKDFIEQCKKGDRTAQRRFFEQLYPHLYRVSLRYLSGQNESEDCVMRSFMKAFANLDSFRYTNEQSLFFWIRRIVVNESLMVLRKVRNFRMVPVEDATDELMDQEEIVGQIAAEELYSLIRQLPLGYRTVFNLYVIEGYTHQEIAGMLQISDVTSRSQLAKAKAKLKSFLLDYGYEQRAAGE